MPPPQFEAALSLYVETRNNSIVFTIIFFSQRNIRELKFLISSFQPSILLLKGSAVLPTLLGSLWASIDSPLFAHLNCSASAIPMNLVSLCQLDPGLHMLC